jgi:L-lactate dehydrogenase
MLNGEYGINECCLSVPCIVNKKGVNRIVETELDQAEENDLKQSAQILKDVYRRVTFSVEVVTKA